VVADKRAGFSYLSAVAMIGAEIFTTIAQLAVGVTGFSGIVIAFNRQPGRLSDFEAFRILILFTNSLAAMFLSLIPFAFYYMRWNETTLWRTGNASIAIFELTFLLVFTRLTLKFLRQHRELFNVALLSIFGAGHALNAVVQLFSALGWISLSALSVFILGLLWLLFHSTFQFGRIIFVQPIAQRKND
jgi:hypothetical protein